MYRGVKVEDSSEIHRTDIDEKSPITIVSIIAFIFDSDTIFLGFLRYAGHTERLHLHHWKVKNSIMTAECAIRI